MQPAMKLLLSILAIFSRSSIALQMFKTSENSTSKPHVLLILADDLGWNGVGYRGTGVKTPTIDSLAENGVKLESFYTFVYCAPSRMSLLTGRDAWKSEAGYSNFQANVPIGTSTEYTMLPAALKTVGYATHMIGKWHQGFHTPEYMPRSRGFDSFYGIMTSSTDHYNQEVGHDGGIGDCKYNNNTLIDMIDTDGPAYGVEDGSKFGDDRYSQRAVNIISKHDKKRPMFMYLSLQMPHFPYQVPEEFANMYSKPTPEENIYWGMMSHLDHSIKKVVDALNDADMYKDTIILFSSDNGAAVAVTDEPFNANAPLKGHKGQLFEGGIKVPAFVSGGFLPSQARGRTLDGITSIADWYATLAHITGMVVDQKGPFPSDSVNNWDYIVGNSEQSARSEQMLHYAPPKSGHMSALIAGKWKYLALPAPYEPKLFDLKADPGEEQDVSKKNPEIVESMSKKVEASLAIALKMPWFYVEDPKPSEALSMKSCHMWVNAKGFLVPWAANVDETDFHFEHVK